MANGNANRDMLRQLFRSLGLDLSDQDLETVSDLHISFAAQRHRLTGAARPETEPMTIADFARVLSSCEGASR